MGLRGRWDMKWQVLSNMLLFERLDNTAVPVFTLGFKLTDSQVDPWSQRFTAFKFGDEAAQRHALEGAIRVMTRAVSLLPISGPVVLVSAIPSMEVLLPKSSQLARLGEGIAAGARWRWLPGHISKRPHRSLKTLHGSGSGPERDAEVANTYSANHIDATTVIVLDDFVTRGSTIGDVARAIRLTSPQAQVMGLALAKTERVVFWEGTATPASNSHLDESVRKLWDGEG